MWKSIIPCRTKVYKVPTNKDCLPVSRHVIAQLMACQHRPSHGSTCDNEPPSLTATSARKGCAADDVRTAVSGREIHFATNTSPALGARVSSPPGRGGSRASFFRAETNFSHEQGPVHAAHAEPKKPDPMTLLMRPGRIRSQKNGHFGLGVDRIQ